MALYLRKILNNDTFQSFERWQNAVKLSEIHIDTQGEKRCHQLQFIKQSGIYDPDALQVPLYMPFNSRRFQWLARVMWEWKMSRIMPLSPSMINLPTYCDSVLSFKHLVIHFNIQCVKHFSFVWQSVFKPHKLHHIKIIQLFGDSCKSSIDLPPWILTEILKLKKRTKIIFWKMKNGTHFINPFRESSHKQKIAHFLSIPSRELAKKFSVFFSLLFSHQSAS